MYSILNTTEKSTMDIRNKTAKPTGTSRKMSSTSYKPTLTKLPLPDGGGLAVTAPAGE